MNYLLDVNVLVAWGLAAAHGAKLATLDTGIPGAFLIPADVANGG